MNKRIPVPNVDHYPVHQCRNCGCDTFDTSIQIRYNPLNYMDKYLIPIYRCTSCGNMLDLKVNPKKMHGHASKPDGDPD